MVARRPPEWWLPATLMLVPIFFVIPEEFDETSQKILQINHVSNVDSISPKSHPYIFNIKPIFQSFEFWKTLKIWTPPSFKKKIYILNSDFLFFDCLHFLEYWIMNKNSQDWIRKFTRHIPGTHIPGNFAHSTPQHFFQLCSAQACLFFLRLITKCISRVFYRTFLWGLVSVCIASA